MPDPENKSTSKATTTHTTGRARAIIELYLDAIVVLKNIAKQKKDKSFYITLLKSIDVLRSLIHHHEKDPYFASTELFYLLAKIKKSISPRQKSDIENVMFNLNNFKDKRTAQEKFNNPVARRYESQVAVSLLAKPTTAMMASVARISECIIEIITSMMDKQENVALENFLLKLFHFKQNQNLKQFGTLNVTPTNNVNKLLRLVLDILDENKAEDLHKIIQIHFIFSITAFRWTSLKTLKGSQSPPLKQFKELVTDEWENYDRYQKDLFDADHLPEKRGAAATFIQNKVMYSNTLFKAYDRKRGIQSKKETDCMNNQLGMFTAQQMLDAKMTAGLPKINDVDEKSSGTDVKDNKVKPSAASWFSEARAVIPDLQSPCVSDLTKNDVVYVAGYSGVCSCLLGQACVFSAFDNTEQYIAYLSAFAAHLAASGQHSLHEAIAPAHYYLDLIPGYYVAVPDAKQTARAANYDVFFDTLCRADDNVSERLFLASEGFESWYEDFFLSPQDKVKLGVRANGNAEKLPHLYLEKPNYERTVLLIKVKAMTNRTITPYLNQSEQSNFWQTNPQTLKILTILLRNIVKADKFENSLLILSRFINSHSDNPSLKKFVPQLCKNLVHDYDINRYFFAAEKGTDKNPYIKPSAAAKQKQQAILIQYLKNYASKNDQQATAQPEHKNKK